MLPSPLTIPAVTAPRRPHGCPTAKTSSPTRRASESPTGSVGRSSAGASRSRSIARSNLRLLPTTSAPKERSSARITSVFPPASAPAALGPSNGPRDSRLIAHPLTALADGNAQGRKLAPADHPDRHLTSDPVARKERLQLVGVRDGRGVQGDEDVAEQHPTLPSGAIILDAHDEKATTPFQAHPLGGRQADGLAQDAQVAALYGATLRERPGGAPGDISRHGECHAPGQPERRDPEHGAFGVCQRPTREARVGRRIGLDVPFEPRSPARAQRPADGANDPEARPYSLPGRTGDGERYLPNSHPSGGGLGDGSVPQLRHF